ncbi:DUF4232 domain-containing protein [Marinactinospora thermotolerans]|nr:DUF4232 domain-containing protein [Marinactinospora thermotolerans]
MSRSRVTGTALLVGATSTVLVTAGATNALAAGPVSAPLSVADCTAAVLEVDEVGRRTVDGTTHIDFEIVKLPPRTPYDDEACVMYGDLAAMYWGDSEGNPIGAPGVRDGAGGDPFALFPGEAARLTVAKPDPDGRDPGECDPVEVAGVHLFFRNDEGAEYVPTRGADRICVDPAAGDSRFSPLTRP